MNKSFAAPLSNLENAGFTSNGDHPSQAARGVPEGTASSIDRELERFEAAAVAFVATARAAGVKALDRAGNASHGEFEDTGTDERAPVPAPAQRPAFPARFDPVQDAWESSQRAGSPSAQRASAGMPGLAPGAAVASSRSSSPAGVPVAAARKRVAFAAAILAVAAALVAMLVTQFGRRTPAEPAPASPPIVERAAPAPAVVAPSPVAESRPEPVIEAASSPAMQVPEPAAAPAPAPTTAKASSPPVRRANVEVKSVDVSAAVAAAQQRADRFLAGGSSAASGVANPAQAK